MSKLNLTINGKDLTDVERLKAKITDTDNYAEFVNTDDATAEASDIAQGKTAYVKGNLVTGTGSGGGSDFICSTLQTNMSNVGGLYDFVFELKRNISQKLVNASMQQFSDFFTSGDVKVWYPRGFGLPVMPVSIEYHITSIDSYLSFSFEESPGSFRTVTITDSTFYDSSYFSLLGIENGEAVSHIVFEDGLF